MAGNGTIGLELVEDLDEIDAVVIPWGGGGLTTGIASALHALRPETKVVVCEPETGRPWPRRIANGARPGAGRVHAVVHRRRRLGRRSSPRCGSTPSRSSTDAFAISLEDAAAAVRMLAERRGSSPRAPQGSRSRRRSSGRAGSGRVVCIVSGGNIDAARLAAILDGRVPD